MAAVTLHAGVARITLEIEGYERVDVGLSRFAQAIQDFRPFWRTVAAPWFFAAIVENFATEGRPVGGWRPLSPRYAAWKARHYPGKTILRRTDRLITSLTWTGASLAGREGIARFAETQAELGTAVPYAAAHQHGSSDPPGRPPQRRVLYLPVDASRTLAKALQQWAVMTLRSHLRSQEASTPVLAGPGRGVGI